MNEKNPGWLLLRERQMKTVRPIKTPEDWYNWNARGFSVKIPWEKLPKETQEFWTIEFEKRQDYDHLDDGDYQG